MWVSSVASALTCCLNAAPLTGSALKTQAAHALRVAARFGFAVELALLAVVDGSAQTQCAGRPLLKGSKTRAGSRAP